MKDLHLGDCLDIVPALPAQSVDAIITDIPYGTTACKWDTIIPFDDLWRIVKHVLKPKGAFVTTASQPFTSLIIASNLNNFKVEWIWKKNAGSNFALMKYQPMKERENIIVFSEGSCNYNPQMQERSESGLARVKSSRMTINRKKKNDDIYSNMYETKKYKADELRYPSSVQVFNRERGLHPTQKPVALYEYLIKTYTNEGETVLDICMGSGTTGVACKNTGRNFIGIEKDPAYFEIARKRIHEV